MAQPQFVGSLTVPRQRTLRAGDLESQAVLSSRSRLGHVEGASGPAAEMEKRGAVVFGADRHRFGVAQATHRALKRLDGSPRTLARRQKCAHVSAHPFDL